MTKFGLLGLIVLVLAGCSTASPGASASAPTSANPSAGPSFVTAVEDTYDLGDGRTLTMACFGSGSPTIVLQPGGTDQGGRQETPTSTLYTLGEHATACVYDRDELDLPPDALPDRSIFDHVADLRALLRAAKVDCPCIWVGTSFGGAFALASALDDPAATAGLVIVDTDFLVKDGQQRCIDLGIPADQCAPDPGDRLALTWGQQVADAVVPLPGIPVRVITSDKFTSDCPEGWDCDAINARTVAYQGTDWATLSSDFSQTIVHVYHDELASGAAAEITATILGLIPQTSD
jgi:pimeloyl-ACP methyl ester carboxylesterase